LENAVHINARTLRIADSLDRALGFLAERQLPSGAFEIRVGLDLRSGETAPDPSVFATSLIAYSLSFCEDARAREMLDRAAEHLVGQMESPGVWRHWTREHESYHGLPADLDDTACISMALRRAGADPPANSELVLANRDPNGRFYTWLVARWPPARQLGIWRLAARRLRHPLSARMFWRWSSAAPDDVDGVVNANALAYLGDGPHAAAAGDYLARIVWRGEEERCDKWYRSPLVFHHALSRCHDAGVAPIEALREESRRRIELSSGADGEIGNGPLDTALAVSALMNWESPPGECADACAYLLRTQRRDGSWPAEPMYFGGPAGGPYIPEWGAEELTTGLCVEALVRATAA
jgi:hypothetical protein